MRSSPWSELPARTTSMLRTSRHRPDRPRELKKTNTSNRDGRVNGAQGSIISRAPVRRIGNTFRVPAKTALEPERSAALCNQLLSESEGLTSFKAATAWAHRILGAKNSLTVADARRVGGVCNPFAHHRDALRPCAQMARRRSGPGQSLPAEPGHAAPSNAAHQRDGIRPRVPFALARRFELFAL
jgi:hypothetical protein